MSAESWFGIANLVAAVVIPLATVVSVWLLRQSVQEARLLREMQDEPHIVVSAWLKSPASNLLYLWVENTGSGTAYDVKLGANKAVDSFPFEVRPLSNVGIFKTGVPCFPPRHQLSFLFGELTTLRTSEFATLEITATCHDKKQKGYSEVFKIDARAQAGMTDAVERNPLEQVKQSIDDVANAIRSHR